MYRHGKNNTPLYHRWEGMIQRTTNPNDKSFSHYGARGIKVCKEWRNDFMSFYDWAINNGYHPSLSLDRIDVNKGYEPNNCRWVDAKIQSNNKTNNITVNFKGEKMTLSQISELSNIPVSTLWGRYNKGDRGNDLVRAQAPNKGKFTSNSCIKHPTKLTENNVIEIKKAISNSSITNKELALRYNVSPSTINDIRKNRTWKNVKIHQDNTELTK